MLKRLLTLQATALPYMTMALGGLIGAAMALAAIALGQRLKRGALDAPHDPTPFI